MNDHPPCPQCGSTKIPMGRLYDKGQPFDHAMRCVDCRFETRKTVSWKDATLAWLKPLER